MNNNGSSIHFKRSSDLMRLMLQLGICQYFYNQDEETQSPEAPPKSLQELFVKGLTLYFTLTGKNSESERMTNFEIYEELVSDQVKEVMMTQYKSFNEWAQNCKKMAKEGEEVAQKLEWIDSHLIL